MSNAYHTTRAMTGALALACAGLLATGLTACRGERSEKPPRQFIPDMDDSPKYKPQTHTEFFADGRAMRPRVAGTVAFGGSWRTEDADRGWHLPDDPAVFEGIDVTKPAEADGTPAYVDMIPASVIDRWMQAEAARGSGHASRDAAFGAMISRGQERFNIYCSVCHGFKGEGGDPEKRTGGMVGLRWMTPVPSLHDPKYLDKKVKTGKDGYVFHTIQHGVPETDPTKPTKMPSYADKINKADAWAVVAYLRVLQASWTEDMQRVPPDERIRLERSKPPAPPAPAPAAPAAPTAGSATPAANSTEGAR